MTDLIIKVVVIPQREESPKSPVTPQSLHKPAQTEEPLQASQHGYQERSDDGECSLEGLFSDFFFFFFDSPHYADH